QNQRVNTEKAGEQGTGKAAGESGSGASQLGAGDSVQNAQGSNNAVAANTSQQHEMSSAAKDAASGATPAALPNVSSSTAPSTGPLGAPSTSNPSGSTILSVPVKGSGASAPTAPTRYRIEYMPIRRELKSAGGWDLDMVHEFVAPILDGRGKIPRGIHDLGMSRRPSDPVQPLCSR
ncbi:hypothetical protein OC846_006969, partial [Tilletia horrida]